MVSPGRRCCDVEVVVVEDVVRGCVVSPNRVLAAIGLECFPSDFSQLRTTFFFFEVAASGFHSAALPVHLSSSCAEFFMACFHLSFLFVSSQFSTLNVRPLLGMIRSRCRFQRRTYCLSIVCAAFVSEMLNVPLFSSSCMSSVREVWTS